MKNYDTIIILSHGPSINEEGVFGETKKRLDKGIGLYLDGLVRTITLSGGRTNKNFSYSESGIMYLYVVNKQVPKKNIYKEEESLDTVSQAIFSKIRIIVSQNWRRLIVSSSDYHIPRVKEIFDFVYGKNFDINYVDVESGRGEDKKTRKKELRSLKTFHRTFKGIESGNDREILKRLFETHPLYKVKATGGI